MMFFWGCLFLKKKPGCLPRSIQSTPALFGVFKNCYHVWILEDPRWIRRRQHRWSQCQLGPMKVGFRRERSVDPKQKTPWKLRGQPKKCRRKYKRELILLMTGWFLKPKDYIPPKKTNMIMEHPPWMSWCTVFPIFEWWKFPAWKIHSFRSPRSTYLSCGAERLNGFKEPGWGKQVDGKNSWRDAEGEEDSNVDVFFFFPCFFCQLLSFFVFFFLFFSVGMNVWEVQVFLVSFWQGCVVWAEYFCRYPSFAMLFVFFLSAEKPFRKSTMEKKRKKGWLEKFHNWPSDIRYQ